MSFITRCPACQTAFKVVTDQLKISEGWVRCGQCQQVFDATLDLQPWHPGSEPKRGAATIPDPVPPVSDTVETTAPAERLFSSASVSGAALVRVSVPDDAADCDAVPQTLERPTDASPPDAASTVERSTDDGLPPIPLSTPPVHGDRAVHGREVWRADPLPDLGFVRQAQRQARWRHPGVRWALVVLVAVLSVLLVWQMAVHWRHQWVARLPGFESVMRVLCLPSGCQVDPPRQLSDLVIDSSTLLRREPGRYTFNLVVRNQSQLVLASPALELTLTDVQDQVLVRRVWLPQEWPQPRATLAAYGEWPVQFELELAAPQAQLMTGYRALLFYP